MHLDRKFGIIVASSLVWGAIVSLMFYRVAAGSRNRPGPEKALVVAARPLAPGAQIDAEAVKTVRVPENLFPKGGFGKIEDVEGRPVISSIQADEPLVEARLAARGSGFGVAPMIPPGMRAVAVRVNDVAGVAGFVLPGMRVDVLVTGKPPGAEDTLTATVLQNIPVLSAGQAVEADAKSQSMSVPVVTLLVSPAQAESLTLATSEGHVQLVLRNSGDQQLTQTPGRQLRDLYARGAAAPAVAQSAPQLPKGAPPVPTSPAASAATAPAALPAAPPAALESMMLISGTHKTVETFGSKEERR